MLSLVLPKGSLETATLELFDAADLTVRRSSDRDYHASIDDPRIDKVRFLRPQEIPSYLERGLFDLGITGRDWIAETEADVVSLGELQYSKATSQPVRVVLAVPDSTSWQSAADLPEGVRISTEFPSLTKRFLDAHGVKAMVIPSYGATEAKVPDIVDAIVDLTPALRAAGAQTIPEIPTSKIVESRRPPGAATPPACCPSTLRGEYSCCTAGIRAIRTAPSGSPSAAPPKPASPCVTRAPANCARRPASSSTRPVSAGRSRRTRSSSPGPATRSARTRRSTLSSPNPPRGLSAAWNRG